MVTTAITKKRNAAPAMVHTVTPLSLRQRPHEPRQGKEGRTGRRRRAASPAPQKWRRRSPRTDVSRTCRARARSAAARTCFRTCPHPFSSSSESAAHEAGDSRLEVAPDHCCALVEVGAELALGAFELLGVGAAHVETVRGGVVVARRLVSARVTLTEPNWTGSRSAAFFIATAWSLWIMHQPSSCPQLISHQYTTQESS